FHGSGALGNNFARANELPTVGGVGGDGLADGGADLLAESVEECEGDLAAIFDGFVERAGAAAENESEILGIELGGGEAFGDQIDGLLGEALGDVAGIEIAAAVEGSGVGAL